MKLIIAMTFLMTSVFAYTQDSLRYALLGGWQIDSVSSLAPGVASPNLLQELFAPYDALGFREDSSVLIIRVDSPDIHRYICHIRNRLVSLSDGVRTWEFRSTFGPDSTLALEYDSLLRFHLHKLD